MRRALQDSSCTKAQTQTHIYDVRTSVTTQGWQPAGRCLWFDRLFFTRPQAAARSCFVLVRTRGVWTAGHETLNGLAWPSPSLAGQRGWPLAWVGERARELEFWRERWPWQKRLLATEFTQPLVYPPLLVLSTIRVGRCKG